MTALPIALTVTRYRCPFCTRSRAKKATTAEHIARCWHNPEVRACLTCEHHEPAVSSNEQCIPGRDCNCGSSPEGCYHPDGPRPFEAVRTDCPLWQDRAEATT